MIDLLVAGGGPGGLATATHAAKAGLQAVVVERRPGPIDKACGEGLMPHTVKQLRKLGVSPDGKAFRGITYLDATRSVRADFRSGQGMGMRRTALSEALHDAASSAGVRIVHGDIGDVSQDVSSVRCGDLRARYLAAADGLHSPIRRSLGLELPSRGRRRWGIRRHFQVAPWSDTVEVYWAHDTEAYVTPLAADSVGVAVLTSRKGRFDDHLAEFPALAARLAGVPHDSDRAAGPLRQRVRSRTSGRVMLVGDAAGYVDALTGEGMGIAFGGAELLVNCVLADAPGDYDRQWRQMSRRYRALTARLLHASGCAPVRSMLVPAASALPRAFSGIVNLLAY
jgi:flavin-dependent dehydrogenase